MEPLPVLLVTAEPERRARLADLLAAAGHQLTTAPTAEAAADALRASGAGALLLDLDWPGLDRAALASALAPAVPTPPDSLADAERRHIALTLAHTRGNKRQAALLLGISRSTLLHKIRRYGLAAVATRSPARG